jgi:hypothetical protein
MLVDRGRLDPRRQRLRQEQAGLCLAGFVGRVQESYRRVVQARPYADPPSAAAIFPFTVESCRTEHCTLFPVSEYLRRPLGSFLDCFIGVVQKVLAQPSTDVEALKDEFVPALLPKLVSCQIISSWFDPLTALQAVDDPLRPGGSIREPPADPLEALLPARSFGTGRPGLVESDVRFGSLLYQMGSTFGVSAGCIALLTT